MATVRYSDEEIEGLLREQKSAPGDFQTKIVPKPKRGHKGAELQIVGQAGNCFVVMVRVSESNALDFSVILAVEPKGSSQRFILRRYNGKSHEHGNQLERTPVFYDFHMHTATERYQRAGLKEESFAEVTARYTDWRSALDCLIGDCNIELPGDRGGLFASL